MRFRQRLFCVPVCFALVTTANAQTVESWLDQFLRIPIGILPALPAPVSPSAPPCAIEAIPPVDDEEAVQFESAVGTSNVVDRTGLTPATALALKRFESRVTALGGKFNVTSAYRPPSYQFHLQLVWDRWVQLRDNRDPGCAVLRAEVEGEFDRHGLLESQRPVPVSDHTKGIGFDASIWFPKVRRSIDRLAAIAGVRRPDVVHDPVHFRLIANMLKRQRT